MRQAVIVALLCMLATVIFAQATSTPEPTITSAYRPVVRGLPWANPEETCPSCSIFTTQPFLASSLDEEAEVVSTSMGVMNASGVKPVEGATIFVIVYNASQGEIYNCKMSTSEQGIARFDYGDLRCDDGCTIRLLFCCSDPVGLACVLAPCLQKPEVESAGQIRDCKNYEGMAPGAATVDNESIELYPTFDEVIVPPKPPTPVSITFTFCFPILVIFGFLAAAMYASGRDPFAMFSFYTPRYTRGMERPIGGRGYTIPGSGLANIYQTVKGFAGAVKEAKTAAAEFASGERAGAGGRVQMAAGTGGRGGAGEGTDAQERQRLEQAAALRGAGGAPAIGPSPAFDRSQGLPAGENLAGPTGLNLFGTIMLTIMKALLMSVSMPWMVGSVADAIDGVVSKWQRDAQADFAQNRLGSMLETMNVTRNSKGEITAITYTHPESGERVTVRGVDNCSAFLEANVSQPIAALQARDANQAAALFREFNRAVGAERLDSAYNAVALVNAEIDRTRAQLETTTDEGERGRLQEKLDALTILADTHATVEAKQAAFETLCHQGGLAGDVAELRLVAFTAATAGMNYEQLAEFVSGSQGARQVLSDLANGDSLLYSSLADHNGNLRAAIALATGNLEVIGSTRAEGQADSLGLGTSIGAAQAQLIETRDIGFGYRAGTDETLADRLCAMGLSDSALGTARVDFASLNVNMDYVVSADSRAEIEAAIVDGKLDLSLLSGDARSALLQATDPERQGDLETTMNNYDAASRASYALLTRDVSVDLAAMGVDLSRIPEANLREMGLDPANLEGAGPVSLSAVDSETRALLLGATAEDQRGTLTGILDSYERSPVAALAAVSELAGSGTGPVNADGTLNTEMADRVAAALREHGMTGGFVAAMSGIGALEASEQNLGQLRALADPLTMSPSDYALRMSGRLEDQQRALGEMQDTYRDALAILTHPPESSSEGSREWASGFMQSFSVQMLADVSPEFSQALEAVRALPPSATREEQQQANMMLYIAAYGVAGNPQSTPEQSAAANLFLAPSDVDPVATGTAMHAYFERESQELGQQANRYERASDLLADPTPHNAAEYARLPNDDSSVPQIREQREAAHEAVATLQTSTDEAARREAERTLQLLGVPPAYLGPLVERPAGTAGYQEMMVGTAAENTNGFVDNYYDNRRAMEITPETAVTLARNFVYYDTQNEYAPENPLALQEARDALGPARDAAVQARAADDAVQVALLGPQAAESLGDERVQQIAEGAQARIAEDERLRQLARQAYEERYQAGVLGGQQAGTGMGYSGTRAGPVDMAP